MASDVRRKAAAEVVKLIDDWFTKVVDLRQPEDPGPPPEVRREMLRLKETFESVAAAEDSPKPEGWTPGNPMVGVCNCNDCVDRKTREAKARDELKDPT